MFLPVSLSSLLLILGLLHCMQLQLIEGSLYERSYIGKNLTLQVSLSSPQSINYQLDQDAQGNVCVYAIVDV